MKLTDVLNPGRIIFRGRTYSPDEVRASIDDLARHLGKILPPNRPFVYLFGENHVKFIFAYFAIIKSGHICVIIEPKVGPIEYAEHVAQVPPAAVIRIKKETMEWDLEEEITVRENGAEYTDELDDVCTMIFHAADDGFAKALMLTNRSLYVDALEAASASGTCSTSLVCVLLPYCHLFSLNAGVLSPFLVGAGVLLQEATHAKHVRAVFDEALTHVSAVPAVLQLMVKAKASSPELQLPQNCILNSGGYRLSEELFQRFHAEFKNSIREGYGLSEASPVCAWQYSAETIKPNSVGTAFRCCKIIVTDDSGQSIQVRAVGEIRVSGENIFKGYYKDLSATRSILRDGWLRTRDVGWLDEEGYLYLTSNTRRMLNVMGKKVFPAEVERLVRMNSNVADVTVYGTWRDISGHSVLANVKFKRPGEASLDELRTWCRNSITSYKIPRFVEC